jgi:hypothetical protein
LKPVRVLAALGAICFAYLAIIPGAVVGATIHPACSGSQCSYSPPVTVFMVFIFAATSLALLASGVTLALYAVRPSTRNARLIAIALKASAVAIGVVLLSELALPDPVAAIVIVGVCVPVALLGTARRSSRARPPGADTHRAPG